MIRTKPVGVFMLCGHPASVNRNRAGAAESLYGGEQNVITINMSEFREAHNRSTLKGAPHRYGEGGAPRSCAAVHTAWCCWMKLKSAPDVHEIFFRVFDKGWMEDGEGAH